jgi:hypothetical protein
MPFHRDLPVVTPTLRPGEQEALAAPQGLTELQKVRSSNLLLEQIKGKSISANIVFRRKLLSIAQCITKKRETGREKPSAR